MSWNLNGLLSYSPIYLFIFWEGFEARPNASETKRAVDTIRKLKWDWNPSGDLNRRPIICNVVFELDFNQSLVMVNYQ